MRRSGAVAITDDIRGQDVGDGRVAVLGDFHDENLLGAGTRPVRAACDGHTTGHSRAERWRLKLNVGTKGWGRVGVGEGLYYIVTGSRISVSDKGTKEMWTKKRIDKKKCQRQAITEA